MPARAGWLGGRGGGRCALEVVVGLEADGVVDHGVAHDMGMDGPEEAGTVRARGLQELSEAAAFQEAAGGEQGLEAGVVAGVAGVALGQRAEDGAVFAHPALPEEVEEREDGGIFAGGFAQAGEVGVHRGSGKGKGKR